MVSLALLPLPLITVDAHIIEGEQSEVARKSGYALLCNDYCDD